MGAVLGTHCPFWRKETDRIAAHAAVGRLTAIQLMASLRRKSIRDASSGPRSNGQLCLRRRRDGQTKITKSDDDYNNYNSIIPSRPVWLRGPPWVVECCEFRKNPIAHGKFDFPERGEGRLLAAPATIYKNYIMSYFLVSTGHSKRETGISLAPLRRVCALRSERSFSNIYVNK